MEAFIILLALMIVVELIDHYVLDEVERDAKPTFKRNKKCSK